MGRKPKNHGVVPSLTAGSPSKERVEQQATNGNIKQPTMVVDSQPENPQQPKCSPLKHSNLSVDGVGASIKTNTPQVQMNQEMKQQKKYPTFKRKNSKSPSPFVRRSGRIKSGAVCTPTTNQGIEQNGVVHIEEITVSESDKDEPATQIEPLLQEPEPEPQPQLELEQESAKNLSGKSLEEKFDYVIELIKSKVDGNYETPTMSSISYRSMYIDSQKKLGVLTNQNQQLTAELAIALAKIEMYERHNRVLSEPLDKLKDTANAAVSILSDLAKTAEAVVVGASTHAIDNSASKRMRIES